MSNSNFVGVENTLLSTSSLQPPLMQMGVSEPSYLSAVADCSTTNVDLSLDSSLLLAALNNPNGLYCLPKSGADGAALLLGTADTAAVAAKLQSILGLSTAGQKVILNFNVFATSAKYDLSLTSAGTTHIPILLFNDNPAATKYLRVATNAPAAGSCENALVCATATNVTAGAEVITFNIVQQAY